MNAGSLSLIFTGHMVDLPGRVPPRFPPDLEEAARNAIEQRILYHAEGCARSAIKGFASLARGGDILFHEICRSLGVATYIVLPFAPLLFLTTSVAGVASGNWPQRFQKLWDDTQEACRTDLGLPQSDEAYVLCNDKILQLAKQEGTVQLIALLDESSVGGSGGTADFIERSKRESGRAPDIIDPKTLA